MLTLSDIAFDDAAACVAFAITWLLTLSLLPFGWFVVSIFSCISAATYRR